MWGKQSPRKPSTTLRNLLQQHQQHPERDYIINTRTSNSSSQCQAYPRGNEENYSWNDNLPNGAKSGSGKKEGLFRRMIKQMKSRQPLQEVEGKQQEEMALPFEKVKLQVKQYQFCFQHSRTPRAEKSLEGSQVAERKSIEVEQLSQESAVEKYIMQSGEARHRKSEKNISVDFSFDDINQHLQSMKLAGMNSQQASVSEPRDHCKSKSITSPVQELLKGNESIASPSPKVVLTSMHPKLEPVCELTKQPIEIAGTKKVESRVYEQERMSKDIKIDFDLDIDFI